MRQYRTFGTRGNYTGREIVVAVTASIIALFLLFSLISSIEHRVISSTDWYEVSTKIYDANLFTHVVETKQSEIMAEGVVYTSKPVTEENIDGEYIYIKREYEREVMKTRQVSYSCGPKGKDTCWRTETYWEWDNYGTDTWEAPEIEFLGITMGLSEYDYIPTVGIDTVYLSRKERYVFSGVHNGSSVMTSWERFEDKGKYSFEYNTIENKIAKRKSGVTGLSWVFRALSVIIVLLLAGVFLEAENDWLNR